MHIFEHCEDTFVIHISSYCVDKKYFDMFDKCVILVYTVRTCIIYHIYSRVYI